jgi:hypothetical protein
MSSSVRSFVSCVVVLVCGAAVAHGQWSEDPAANLVLADHSGEQVQPKVVALPDGGFYVSWFDSSTGGYDVYLQRLDAAGVEQWPHNGVLVADRGYSSTQDYGLAFDTDGNALLAFRDDRGGIGDEVTVAKIAPDGLPSWGPNGIQVWSAGGFVASPRVAGTADGNIVVAWTHDSDVMFQKLDPNGSALWGAGVTLTPTSGSFMLSDLKAADAGTVIVSFIHQPVFMTNHLFAQKLASADGALLWGAGHVPVLDNGSLQMGNFPTFVSDGSGGAVFAWYVNSDPYPTYLEVRVQRVLANGTEAFAHGGVQVSTNDARQRVDPSAAFLPATQEIVVFWTEENSDQSQWGLYGQKVDPAGLRQWTDNGDDLVPLGASQITNTVTLPFADGAVVAWSDGISFGNEPIRAARVDSGGDFVWSTPIVDLKTSATGTWRITGALSSQGFAAYAWGDGATGDYDVLAQNVNGDGSLGGAGAIFADGFEAGDTSAWSATVP